MQTTGRPLSPVPCRHVLAAPSSSGTGACSFSAVLVVPDPRQPAQTALALAPGAAPRRLCVPVAAGARGCTMPWASRQMRTTALSRRPTKSRRCEHLPGPVPWQLKPPCRPCTMAPARAARRLARRVFGSRAPHEAAPVGCTPRLRADGPRHPPQRSRPAYTRTRRVAWLLLLCAASGTRTATQTR
jgi:hypothetical protein